MKNVDFSHEAEQNCELIVRLMYALSIIYQYLKIVIGWLYKNQPCRKISSYNTKDSPWSCR